MLVNEGNKKGFQTIRLQKGAGFNGQYITSTVQVELRYGCEQFKNERKLVTITYIPKNKADFAYIVVITLSIIETVFLRNLQVPTILFKYYCLSASQDCGSNFPFD